MFRPSDHEDGTSPSPDGWICVRELVSCGRRELGCGPIEQVWVGDQVEAYGRQRTGGGEHRLMGGASDRSLTEIGGMQRGPDGGDLDERMNRRQGQADVAGVRAARCVGGRCEAMRYQAGSRER